ncbi:Vacuolar protein sorting-associated protein 41-like protein [Lasiodiplodia hormozganensis]|uniref:Vacuolar protein sorting-associated protein 41-like protein n=1 Tax=Lasiodiplodia hormozganensis TaxID=869390 RepID=A0AA40CV69_9PEZI|nr:Vacuolar protein sorting-associated protein 41-like protein [Lasiodiplodia hormozganensis]
MAAQSNGLHDDELVAPHEDPRTTTEPTTAADVESDRDEDEDDSEDDDDEPKLKYDRLTSTLGSVYRNGDATSAFIVGGDKMIIGTHNGNINVLSMPSFQSLRFYHAHSASVTSVSISPFPPPLPDLRVEPVTRISTEPIPPPERRSTAASTVSSPPSRTPRQPPLPATPSNSIFVATSSIDGHVCVSSLVDQRDVTLRNFRRPINSVALSPEYKSDRSYLSGGLAGNLILTQGGRPGVSAEANTNSAAAAASGWLGSIGLGANTGRDTILHSGEGSISSIKWSLSGRYVAWTNEQGIKIMRSNLKLEGIDSDFAWRRIAHVDRPFHGQWEDMASVWKARIEWIDENNLEPDDDAPVKNGITRSGTDATDIQGSPSKNGTKRLKPKTEKLLVGWGDTAWVIQVDPGGAGTGRNVGERSAGRADIVHKLRFDDCIISGLSLYTPSILLVLAYRTRDDDDNPINTTTTDTTKRGIHHRSSGIQPEVRLIDADTSEEVDVDTLTVSRFETLSAADYHLGTLYVPILYPGSPTTQRGALETISEGIWGAGVTAQRILSSGASIASLGSSGENGKDRLPRSMTGQSSIARNSLAKAGHPLAVSSGLKIFIHSPYDCVIGVKRDLTDHLSWLLDHQNYEDAWELVNNHPEIVSPPQQGEDPMSPTILTPVSSLRRKPSIAEFFADDASQSTISAEKQHNSAAEKEKRRIGDLWMQQLVSAKDWKAAGKVAGKVLGTSSRWEHWVWAFAQAGQFDAITPYIPTKQLHPPLPSLVYEVVLGHYIIRDRVRLKELLDLWDPELFNVNSVINALESKLDAGDITEDTVEGGERGRDWRILIEALAKLYIADGRPKQALQCYIRVQNADATMSLIREYRLAAEVADDIPGFIMVRISREQMKMAPLEELEEASSEAVQLLVEDAYQGLVNPHIVVEQLQERGDSFKPFLFFYMHALWTGKGSESELRTTHARIVDEGRTMVEDFGDLAVELFAEYDRDLLMEFVKTSQSYDYEKACAVCDARQYIPELVYILSKTGEVKKALFLIIDKMGDVSYAISFAKEQDDPDLWDDLLDYSMDKPHFIRGLLEEVGTAIDPITLVRRIPEGLEIEGLRDGIRRMVREYEIQFSISDGVAKVLRSEVASAMETLRAGRKKAVKFEVVDKEPDHVDVFVEPLLDAQDVAEKNDAATITDRVDTATSGFKPGHCVGCGKAFTQDEKETLIGFACGHVYHLSCLLDAAGSGSSASAASMLQAQFAEDPDTSSRSVGGKVAHAHLIRNAISGGCPVCAEVAE